MILMLLPRVIELRPPCQRTVVKAESILEVISKHYKTMIVDVNRDITPQHCFSVYCAV